MVGSIRTTVPFPNSVAQSAPSAYVRRLTADESLMVGKTSPAVVTFQTTPSGLLAAHT